MAKSEDMPEETKDGSGFKVVDRRPFSADGSPRDVPQDREQDRLSGSAVGFTGAVSSGPVLNAKSPRASAEGAGSTSKARETSDSRAEAGGEPFDDGAMEDSEFGTLVSYLYTTAMFQLGLMQGPGGSAIPPDIVNARRTIDMLEVLQNKTRGNLTPTESKLLEDALYDLRVTFVDVQEQLTPKKR